MRCKSNPGSIYKDRNDEIFIEIIEARNGERRRSTIANNENLRKQK